MLCLRTLKLPKRSTRWLTWVKSSCLCSWDANWAHPTCDGQRQISISDKSFSMCANFSVVQTHFIGLNLASKFISDLVLSGLVKIILQKAIPGIFFLIFLTY